MELKQFIKDLAAKLQAAGIDYCITGGYAVSVCGTPEQLFPARGRYPFRSRRVRERAGPPVPEA